VATQVEDANRLRGAEDGDLVLRPVGVSDGDAVTRDREAFPRSSHSVREALPNTLVGPPATPRMRTVRQAPEIHAIRLRPSRRPAPGFRSRPSALAGA